MRKGVMFSVTLIMPLIREYFQPVAILIRFYFNDKSLLFIDANSANEDNNKQKNNGY